jgi:hypothetical protein
MAHGWRPRRILSAVTKEVGNGTPSRGDVQHAGTVSDVGVADHVVHFHSGEL